MAVANFSNSALEILVLHSRALTAEDGRDWQNPRIVITGADRGTVFAEAGSGI
jgi:hypothetical protein